MRQVEKLLITTLLVLIFTSIFFVYPVYAQAGSASELINTVNSLRQSQGLASYTVDAYLMSFAQSQSDYMASLGTWTHNRPDGSTAFDRGIKENVAMGTGMSVNYCVYTAWSDAVHWNTMVGYATGKIGAGVTVKDGNVYYTLNVLPGGNTIQDPIEEDITVSNVESSYPEQENVRFVQQVTTSTPDEFGIITHTVQYGETLWTIAEAYGVPIDQILVNSSLALSTTQVLEGQELIIQTASEPTATASPTVTEIPPTPTSTQPRPTMTPFPTHTPAPTQTPTQPPSIIQRTLGDGMDVGMGLILISGVGLLFVLYLGFIKNPDANNK